MSKNPIDIRALPYNPKLKERAKELRKTGMLHEVLLWKQLKNRQINGLDFHRQQIVGNYIVDFLSPSGFVIEADGSSHNDKIEYDKERDKFLIACGLKVILVCVNDILHNIDGVVKYLRKSTAEKQHTPPLRGTPLREGN